jgi:hypothetical protein
MEPFRVCVLEAGSGHSLLDRAWSWPLDGVSGDGVAAFLQSVRLLARETGAGELLRMVLEVPIAPLPAPAMMAAGPPGGGGLQADAAGVDSTVVTMQANAWVHTLPSGVRLVAVVFADAGYAKTAGSEAAARQRAIATCERLAGAAGSRLDTVVASLTTARDGTAVATSFRASLPPTLLPAIDRLWVPDASTPPSPLSGKDGR